MANVPSHQICRSRRACWYSGESARLRFFRAASSKTLRVSRLIKFTSAIPVGLPIDAPLLCISVANSGIRPICISDIRFNVGKKDLFLGAVQFTIPGALSPLSFPAKVQPEGKIDMYLNQKQVSQFLAESIADGCLNQRTPVKIAVRDQTGGRYLHRTGCKVGDLILL